MSLKITRRQLAGTVLAATAAAQNSAQSPAIPSEELQAAREQSRRSADTLNKVDLPVSAEPAFHFSA
ncbi:MAG: hypothetical protein U0Q18_10020 [Bryobacteraceae bacterium]